MPLLDKQELFNRIREAVEICGWTTLVEDFRLQHPFKLQIFRGEDSISLLIYIWNLTHGGGAARPEAEMRVQITGVLPPLDIQPVRRTLVLGWHEDLRVFAGFDARRHRDFSRQSPSIQIRLPTLEESVRLGISFQSKGNGEIAVAFRPDLFVDYVNDLERLHGFGDLPVEMEILQAAASGEIPSERDLEILGEERLRIVRTVATLHRRHDFRERVLVAYKNSCAFCSLQLNLVDAAHIIPVSDPRSTDETLNGLALCPTHHRSYDVALIGIAEDYRVLTSDKRVTQLSALGLTSGLEQFRSTLREMILLPDDPRNRPKSDYLRVGLEVRGW